MTLLLLDSVADIRLQAHISVGIDGEHTMPIVQMTWLNPYNVVIVIPSELLSVAIATDHTHRHATVGNDIDTSNLCGFCCC